MRGPEMEEDLDSILERLEKLEEKAEHGALTALGSAGAEPYPSGGSGILWLWRYDGGPCGGGGAFGKSAGGGERTADGAGNRELCSFQRRS